VGSVIGWNYIIRHAPPEGSSSMFDSFDQRQLKLEITESSLAAQPPADAGRIRRRAKFVIQKFSMLD
jgi:hypothetical protein